MFVASFFKLKWSILVGVVENIFKMSKAWTPYHEGFFTAVHRA
jgi:hypothetical protein